MDEATKRYRARMKAQAGSRKQMNESEKRGLGRKNKRHQTFPNVQCDFRAKNNANATIRCPKSADVNAVEFKTARGISKGNFCLEHLPVVRAAFKPKAHQGSPRSGM